MKHIKVLWKITKLRLYILKLRYWDRKTKTEINKIIIPAVVYAVLENTLAPLIHKIIKDAYKK